MASIRLTHKSRQTLLKLKEELGETSQTSTLEKVLKEYHEMKVKFKALHWINELNKTQGTKNAIEITN